MHDERSQILKSERVFTRKMGGVCQMRPVLNKKFTPVFDSKTDVGLLALSL